MMQHHKYSLTEIESMIPWERDIYVSLILTGIFIILVSGLFNENSSYCIVTKPVMNNVTEEEYRQAMKIIKTFEFQKKKKNNK